MRRTEEYCSKCRKQVYGHASKKKKLCSFCDKVPIDTKVGAQPKYFVKAMESAR